jgi:hypothetical protein
LTVTPSGGRTIPLQDLEADGCDERELLIGETSQPSDDRLALEVR